LFFFPTGLDLTSGRGVDNKMALTGSLEFNYLLGGKEISFSKVLISANVFTPFYYKLSPSPHANSFIIGTAVINTHPTEESATIEAMTHSQNSPQQSSTPFERGREGESYRAFRGVTTTKEPTTDRKARRWEEGSVEGALYAPWVVMAPTRCFQQRLCAPITLFFCALQPAL
jgi:hypothetical protein